MIFIFIVFFINILISFSRFQQAKYLFIFSSILHSSLYLITARYAPDYGNNSRYFYALKNSTTDLFFTKGDFIYSNLIKFLSFLNFEYRSLPIFILLISIYSIYNLSQTFKHSAGILISSLLFPFMTYLSFCAIRQSLAISFITISISLLFSNKYVPFKKLRIFIFSFFSLFSHFSIGLYYLVFLLFYFFGDYLLNLKSNIKRLYFKLSIKNIIVFISAIILFLILLLFNREVFFQYIVRFTLYTTLSTEEAKYNPQSVLLFVIFSNTLSIYTLFKFFRLSVFSLISKTEKAFVLINFTTIVQFLVLFAPIVALRLSFFSILVAIVSIAILKKYISVNILELRLFSLYINFFILGLLSLASTLTTYRSLLPL